MNKELAILCIYIGCNGFASSELLQDESFPYFAEMVARSSKDATNRVLYAGSSNDTHYLFHETCLGIKEWQFKDIDIDKSQIRQLDHDRSKWLVLKDNDDYKFQYWDFDKAARKFVIRLPQNSALVSPKHEWYSKEKEGHYKDGKPFLVRNHEYEVHASLSPKLKRGDYVSMRWLVDDYSATTNILSHRKLGERIQINNNRILYMTWDGELIAQRGKDRYFYISDSFPVPLELVWDSDLYHETLIPFDEKIVIEAYIKQARDRMPNTKSESCSSISDFWASVIVVPCGQTNVVYYAGTTDGSTILFHETSAGIRKWNLKNANIDKSISMPYTANKDKWIVLKDSGDDRFRHWDWHKEIEGFIQSQSQNSALVKPLSTFYKIEGDLNGSNAWVVRIDEFLVEATLCDMLKKDDKICTQQLYDGSKEEKQGIISKAQHNRNPIVGRKTRDGGLCLAYWNQGKFIHPQELPTERFFMIDNEIVAPFEFLWDGRYDGLLEFDEKIAQRAYLKRVENKTREKP